MQVLYLIKPTIEAIALNCFRAMTFTPELTTTECNLVLATRLFDLNRNNQIKDEDFKLIQIMLTGLSAKSESKNS